MEHDATDREVEQFLTIELGPAPFGVEIPRMQQTVSDPLAAVNVSSRVN